MRQVEAYLEAFALEHDLERHVRYGTRVTRALPCDGSSAGAGACTPPQNGAHEADGRAPAFSGCWAVTTEPSDTQVRLVGRLHVCPCCDDHSPGTGAPPAADPREVDPQAKPRCILLMVVRLRCCSRARVYPTKGGHCASGLVIRLRVSVCALVWQGEASTSSSTSAFDAVVVCNGHYSEPRRPPLRGSEAFPGRILHSHSYRDNAPYAGLTVVVIGASASGEDISREIALVADKVLHTLMLSFPSMCMAVTPRISLSMPHWQAMQYDHQDPLF